MIFTWLSTAFLSTVIFTPVAAWLFWKIYRPDLDLADDSRSLIDRF